MENINSTPTTTRNSNCYTSADGKSFDAMLIMSKVYQKARSFKVSFGRSMPQEFIDDLAMETMVKLQSGFRSYDSSRPLDKWLWAIVYREGCDLLRKEIREAEGRHRMLDEMDSEPYGAYTDAYIIRKENEQQYQKYLDSIEDELKRECMRLAGEHWKPAEIAKEIGWPADKVHRTVCREKKKLEDK